MKQFLFASIVLLSIILSGKAQTKHFDSRLGVADAFHKEPCLTTVNPNIIEGSQVTLISPFKPQLVAKGTVLRRLEKSCSRDVNTSHDEFFYSLKLTKADSRFYDYYDNGAPSVAIVGSVNSVRIVRGIASVDLDGDGRREYFRECTSSEGVHLTVWSGKPLKGKRRWHWYYYLRYGVIPNCKDKEV